MKNRIREVMQKANLSQQDFAAKLGVSPASISNIFIGRTNPTITHAFAVHKAFPEVSMNWLLFGEGEMAEGENAEQTLDKDENIKSIQCNVLLEGIEEGEFTTDFLCTKSDGDLMVRECVFRKKLSLPRTCKLLDFSRDYWTKRGVADWGIVIEKEETANEEE